MEWYSGRLRYTFEHGLKNGNDFIDSGEELLLNRAMIMMHWKKWDGENWVKALDGKASGKIPAKNSNYFQAGSKKD
ncbi:hypothetical protein MSKOL_2448 [Methanosarcina sp. Kolksee]|uniref:Uncharacterized protein n=1 Tax=Methanosarcina vacuolata Z-761 TaxID=1434123 RepID=A0A0E3Q7T8_9EURY|nr:hypothetical protein MSVAZ_2435 [Methanosarcina vacuolata Z-761]AKB48225.1 hypothetical protein MSKOL_2448 [Methanosarcina sp. Kolksee]